MYTHTWKTKSLCLLRLVEVLEKNHGQLPHKNLAAFSAVDHSQSDEELTLLEQIYKPCQDHLKNQMCMHQMNLKYVCADHQNMHFYLDWAKIRNQCPINQLPDNKNHLMRFGLVVLYLRKE